MKELMWGTYGKGGVEHCAGTCPLHQLHWKLLTDCDTEHLQAILRTQRLPDNYVGAIRAILVARGKEPNAFNLMAESEFIHSVSQALHRVAGNPTPTTIDTGMGTVYSTRMIREITANVLGGILGVIIFIVTSRWAQGMLMIVGVDLVLVHHRIMGVVLFLTGFGGAYLARRLHL